MEVVTKVFAGVLLFSAAVMAGNDAEVRVVRQGVSTTPHDPALISNVIALLTSCSVDSTSYAVTPDTWQEALRADAFVLVTFSSSRELNVMASDNQGSAARSFDEILVPLPEGKWPAHIFAKSGVDVHAFTKYRPLELWRVASDPVLGLASVPPYKDLDRILNNSE